MRKDDIRHAEIHLERQTAELEKTNAWMDAFANASMWTHIFQIAGLVLLALILWRVW